MSVRAAIVVGAAALGVAAVLFQIKVQVVAMERKLVVLRKEINEDYWKIRSLEAEIAHLTQPDRVIGLAASQGLEPARLERIVTVEELGFADHLRLAGQKLLVDLEEGQTVELLFRPMPAATRKARAP